MTLRFNESAKGLFYAVTLAHHLGASKSDLQKGQNSC